MNRLTRTLLVLPLLLLAMATGRVHAQEFLDPEEAFKFSARALDAKTIEASWKIADGYYLYKDRFKFALSGAKLGNAQYPAGKIKDDPTFGTVEVYQKTVSIRLPVTREPGGSLPVKLEATFQGCAEEGVCYMPVTSTASLKLAAFDAPKAAAAPQQSAAPASALAGLRSLAGNDGTADLLPPELAFKAEARLKDARTLAVSYVIAENYYLYRDKLKFVVKSPADVSAGDISTPAAEVKDDPTFGRTEVYHQNFTAEVALSRPLSEGEKLVVDALYQGCSDLGVCYPPTTRSFTLAAAGEATPATLSSLPGDAATTTEADLGDAGSIERTLNKGGLWVAVVAFFGFGLALSLTPCVFPMIPILSGIIAGQKNVTHASGFFLSLAYVLGMAITYAIIGVIAAQSGTLLSNALQNPVALGIGAAIFVALALSMFGFYDLQLPSSLQSRLTETSNKLHGGHFTGVFGMGVLSALIVGPCVAPPLAAALAYIAQTGDSLKGGLSLFFLALGMGVPLLAVGLSAGTLMLKAGAWMNGVKYFFGVAMLGVAIWLISPFLPGWMVMALWAALLIISAIYLHALDALPAPVTGWKKFWKGVGVVLLITGIGLLLGALGGSRDVLQPLTVYQGVMAGPVGAPAAVAGQASALPFEKVKTGEELDRRLAEASAAGQPVMLDFYADWCVSCKELEKFTFSDARVQARLKDVLLLKVDVTNNTGDDKELLKRFSLFGPPGLIFWNAQGQQSDYKVIGYEPADKFLASIDKALK